jgi:hypothetical protein
MFRELDALYLSDSINIADMPHSYNRTAFAVGRAAASELVSLYSFLISIELALKDRAASWMQGHFLAQWLTGEADPGLTSLTQQLASALNLLKCTDRSGGSSGIRLDAYPDLRYLRHESDFPGESSTAQLQTCLTLVRDIETVLKGKGISI